MVGSFTTCPGYEVIGNTYNLFQIFLPILSFRNTSPMRDQMLLRDMFRPHWGCKAETFDFACLVNHIPCDNYHPSFFGRSICFVELILLHSFEFRDGRPPLPHYLLRKLCIYSCIRPLVAVASYPIPSDARCFPL